MLGACSVRMIENRVFLEIFRENPKGIRKPRNLYFPRFPGLFCGEPGGIRTHDLLIRSRTPFAYFRGFQAFARCVARCVAGFYRDNYSPTNPVGKSESARIRDLIYP